MHKELNRIENVNGNVLRHSDTSSLLSYAFRNSAGSAVSLEESDIAHIRLNNYNKKTYAEVDNYQVTDNRLLFSLPENMPAGTYHLEIKTTNGIIFPANDATKIILKQSSKASEHQNIVMYGFEEIVNEAVSRIDLDSYAVDEEKIINGVVDRIDFDDYVVDQDKITNDVIDNIVTFHLPDLSQPHTPTDQLIDVTTLGVRNDGSDITSVLKQVGNEHHNLYFPPGEYLWDSVEINLSDVYWKAATDAFFYSTNNTNSVDAASLIFKGGGIQRTTNITENTTEFSNTIKVQSASGFNVDDFVLLKQNVPREHEKVTDLALHRQRWLSTIARVKSISGNEITFHEALPHIFTTSNSPTANVIDVAKNITLDMPSVFDKMGNSTLSNFVLGSYLHNISIKGLRTTQGGGKGIRLNATHTYRISDFTHTKPTALTSGQGYAFQAELGTCYGFIDNAEGYDLRHLIDFSKGAHHCYVQNSRGYNAGFNGHGMNVKHIVFYKCDAYGAGFSFGNDTFLSDEHIVVDSCNVYDHRGGTAYSVSNKSNNIRFVNCSASNVATGVMVMQDAFDVDVIDLHLKNVSNVGMDLRPSSRVRVDGFDVDGFDNIGILARSGVDDVTISRLSLRNGADNAIGVDINGATNIKLFDPVMRDKMLRAVRLRNNPQNITIDRPDIVVDAPQVISEENNTTNDLKVSIKNAVEIRSTRGGEAHGLMSQRGGFNLINSKIDRVLFFDSAVGHTLINNEVNGYFNIRNTKDITILGNYGSASTQFPSENAGNKVIVQANRF